MSELPQRFDHVRRSAGWGGVFALAGVAAICVVGGYLLAAEGDPRWQHLLLSIGVIAFGLVIAAGYMFARGLIDLALKIEGTTFRIYDSLRELQGTQHANRKNLEVIAESSQLSDEARAIAHRDRDRTALRLAINEEIIRGDLEAAYALVEQLEARHGYRNEAARLRREVDLSKLQVHAYKVHEMVEQVRAKIEGMEWDHARREMDRLLAAHPENDEVKELPKLFAAKRGEHKRRLLKDWDESVQRNEVDRGIAILKQLDQYLTRNEAAALEESARGVFRTKLHNLGLQFSFAVSEHNWRDALAVGQQIVEEFPNTRMAQEVRERIQVLSQRAEEMPAEPVAVGASQD